MASIMARRYGPKATEKIGRTMHEFKRGKLRSGSGGKVRSRQQAIAIGISQARRAGYKVPAEPAPSHASRISSSRHAGYKVLIKRGHASMSLDAQVRTYLSNMRPGTEVDARGLARALGGVDPLEADYALERAEKAGLSSTSDGRWFGPAAKSSHNHAKMLNSPLEHVEGVVLPNGAQAEIHIHHGNGGYSGVLVSSRGAEVPMSLGAPAPKSLDEAIRGAKRFLQQVYGKSGDSGRASSGSHEHSPIKLKDRGRGHVWLTVRDGRVIGVMGSYPDRYMGMTLEEARHLARYGSRGASAPRSSHAVRRKARAARVTAYRILLTPDELRAVEFARGRYAWPDMLSAHAAEDGAVAFTESEMWQWTDDVDSDAEGGHSPFPLASPAFAEKLQRFYDSRV